MLTHNGKIAIPDDPKSWRSQQQTNDNGEEPPRRSAIVEPKRKRGQLATVLDDYDLEAHRRSGELADNLFREIVRRAAADKSDA